MKFKKQQLPAKIIKKKNQNEIKDDIFEICIKKGLIEKTPYGYYFTPEFFETLEIYEDE